MSDYSPVNIADATPFTLTAGGTIAGGNLVEMSANDTVIAAAGTNRPIGVAADDVVSGQRVTIWPMTGIIHETPITGTVVIGFGAPVKPAAAGAIDTGTLATLAAAGTMIGIIIRGATGPAKARWIGA